jgi:hypothetical protein
MKIPETKVTRIGEQILKEPLTMQIRIRGLRRKEGEPLKCRICGEMIEVGEEYVCGNGRGGFCVGCVDFE